MSNTNLVSANNLSVGNNLTVANSTILNTIDSSTSINTNLLTTNQIKLNNFDLNARLTNDELQITNLNSQINTLNNNVILSSGTQTISGDKNFKIRLLIIFNIIITHKIYWMLQLLQILIYVGIKSVKSQCQLQ